MCGPGRMECRKRSRSEVAETEGVHVQQGPPIRPPQEMPENLDEAIGGARDSVVSCLDVADGIERQLQPEMPVHRIENPDPPKMARIMNAEERFFSNVCALPFSYPREQYLQGVEAEFQMHFHSLIGRGRGELKPVGEPLVLGHGISAVFGSPMKLGKYCSIPVYIQKEGKKTKFVMAYQSESQGIWRRFVGMTSTIHPNTRGRYYYKGHDEDFLAFGSAIQKRLDGILHSGEVNHYPQASLEIFGLSSDRERDGEYLAGAKDYMIVNNERSVQQQMSQGAQNLDMYKPENRPDLSKIQDFWISGKPNEGLYGERLNLLVNSRNDNFRYGIALTKYGMFVQYVEDARAEGLNSVGSPSRGVMLDRNSRWITTPVVEYNFQTSMDRFAIDTKEMKGEGRWVFLPEMNGIKSVATGHEGRARFLDLHNSRDSPLKDFNDRFKGVFQAISEGKTEDAFAFVKAVKEGKQV